MITDKNISWKRTVLYVPMFQWKNTTTGLSTQPVTGSPFAGSNITTTTATAVEGGIILPVDVNPDFALGFRVHYVCTTALTDLTALTAVVLANFRALHNTAVVAAASTALDTVIGSTTGLTGQAGNSILTNRGIKNGGFLTRSQILAGAVMQWSAAITAATAPGIANGIILSGLLLDYMPMRTMAPHNEIDGQLTTDLY